MPIVKAQIGGERVFENLNVPASYFQVGVGGVNVSTTNSSLNLFFSNPALLSENSSNHLSLNYSNYLADIFFFSTAYAYDFQKVGIIALGVQYFDYGDFTATDATGSANGEFSPRDFSISATHSRAYGNFRYGITAKIASTQIESFSATALLFDLGATFKHPLQDLQFGLALKNLGFLFTDFTDDNTSNIPYDIQIGASFKPEYMPIRFHLTAYNLWRGNIAFFDPDLNVEEPSTGDNIFRHFAIGTEILLGKNLEFLFGYNHLIRRELRLDETSGGAGFSFGLQLRIKAFELGISHGIYSVAGGNTNFSLTTNFQKLIKKKTVKSGNIESNG